jgi:hypothetical protein
MQPQAVGESKRGATDFKRQEKRSKLPLRTVPGAPQGSPRYTLQSLSLMAHRLVRLPDPQSNLRIYRTRSTQKLTRRLVYTEDAE